MIENIIEITTSVLALLGHAWNTRDRSRIRPIFGWQGAVALKSSNSLLALVRPSKHG